MALYAIGDIQGCHAEFCELLDLIGFSPSRDRLWLVGDLVNRGPGSLAVLREVMALGDAATTVLGNHDFHLLTIAAGHRKPHRGDTLDDILAAPDRDALVAWLMRGRSWWSTASYAMVHAGLPAVVDRRRRRSRCRAKCRRCSRATARASSWACSTATSRGNGATTSTGYDRLRVIVNACTRLRFCTRRRHDGA